MILGVFHKIIVSHDKEFQFVVRSGIVPVSSFTV